MFKKLMAKLGVGAATVDLRLDRDAFQLGDEMTGVIRITGGKVEQQISDLQVELVLQAYVRGKQITRVLQTIPVLKSFTVRPEPYVDEIPFRFSVPANLAVSTHSIRYVLRTKLDVVQALDPTDLDYVTFLPPTPIAKVITALERLDFRQKPDSGRMTRYGQEFSFFPGRPLAYPLRELEVVFLESPEGLRLLVELDLAQSGFMRREIEHRGEILIPADLLTDGNEQKLTDFLAEKLEAYALNPASIPTYATGFGRSYGGYDHHRGNLGMGGMLGGMAAGLLGGLLLTELMEDASELFADGADAATALTEDPTSDISDFLSGDDGDYDDGGGGFDDGGGFDGGDFGDF